MTTAENAPSPFARLLELQSIDVHADQLRYQMEHHPARLALDELLARHRKIAERTAPVAQQVAVFAGKQDELEREIEETRGRIATIEKRLQAGTAGSYRDEGAMSEEIASLARRKSHLEDEELEVMEAREPLDAELAEFSREDGTLEAEARERRAELAAAQAELAVEIERVEATRAAVAAELDPALRDEYERLRARFGGIGVARIEHGMCSGCNLSLAAGEIDRIKRGAPGALFHCEQCGRILVAEG